MSGQHNQGCKGINQAFRGVEQSDTTPRSTIVLSLQLGSQQHLMQRDITLLAEELPALEICCHEIEPGR